MQNIQVIPTSLKGHEDSVTLTIYSENKTRIDSVVKIEDGSISDFIKTANLTPFTGMNVLGNGKFHFWKNKT